MLGEFIVGSVFADRYRIDARLGRGGGGTVYLACDTSTGTSVALKILREGRRRHIGLIEIEARLSKIVTDDSLVRVLEIGVSADNVPYLVSELVRGDNLGVVIRNTRVTVEAVLLLAERTARALALLHDHGILHRDVKPANILIPKQDAGFEFAQAKLLDLGVAFVCDRNHTLSMRTPSGLLSGTVRYMAPEQLIGRRQGKVTDIYSLGLVLFETLYGESALKFTDLPVARIRVDLGIPDAFCGPFVDQRLNVQIVAPAHPHIPDGLRELIDQMLSINPLERPPTAWSVYERAYHVRQYWCAAQQDVLRC